MQIETLGPLGLLPGHTREGDRLAVLAGALQVPGDHQPLGRRLPRQAVGRERIGRHAPRGERTLAVAAQLIDRGQVSLGVGQRAPDALCATRRHRLAPRALASVRSPASSALRA